MYGSPLTAYFLSVTGREWMGRAPAVVAWHERGIETENFGNNTLD
jgi:hypothetical protein